MLRAELTRQAEHTRQLEAAHSRATAELTTLRERHTAIEVLREENRALERRAASADELRETVVRLEAEVEAARAERKAWCAVLFFSMILPFGANFVETLGRRTRCQRHPPRHPSRSRRAYRRYVWNTRTFSKNTVRTAPRCASARQNSLKYRRARWTRVRLPMPSSRPVVLQRNARREPSARLRLLSGRWHFSRPSTYVRVLPWMFCSLVPLWDADSSFTNRRATPAKKLRRAPVAWTLPESNTSANLRIWWASTRCRYACSKRTFKNLPSDPLSAKAWACKLYVRNLLTKSRQFKKRGEVRHAVVSLHHPGKLTPSYTSAG